MKQNSTIKKFFITVFVLICVNSWLIASTITIKQDGTGDFTTIQAGINAASHGDIVLAYPGTYYENIDFSGKNITVASLEYTTGDPQYIAQTVIDGQRQASCVSLISAETDAVLEGFTITNGQGGGQYWLLGGGINIFGDYPEMIGCSIINCVITGNVAYNSAGICVDEGNVFLSGCSITNNYAYYNGGGIGIKGHSNVVFDTINRCSVYNNRSSYSVDIVLASPFIHEFEVVVDTFTVAQPNPYFVTNNAYNTDFSFDLQNYVLEPVDHDLYVSPDGDDINSGFSPDEPMKRINTAVHKIASNTETPRTIHLAPGIYSKSMNDQILPFGCKAYVNIIGENQENTIIDGDISEDGILITSRGYEHSTISDLTFQNFQSIGGIITNYSDMIRYDNITIKNCIITDMLSALISATSGGNIAFENVTIENIEGLDTPNAAAWMNGTTGFSAKNCLFRNNTTSMSPGFSALSAGLYVNGNGDMTVEGCRFINNTTTSTNAIGWASALLLTDYNQFIGDSYIHDNLFVGNVNNNGKSTVYAKSMPYTKINFFNNTLIDNVSPYGCEFEGNIYCRNNIMRNIGDYEIALFYDPEITSYLWCSHNNILGGEDAIFNQFGANVVYWEEGNIDVDPQFVLVGDDPYQLAAGSLCIDAGTPDTTGMFLPPWDMLENHRVWDGDGNGEARIDMGCYEFDSEPWAYAHQPVVPAVDYQISNYPNPFNPSTTICFTVPQQGAVKLHVYNIRGQKVATLVDCVSAPGSYNVQWDGRDADNRPVGGGVYFAQLVTPQRTTAHKMILIK